MRISWLQFLRAAAALLVLSGHTLGAASRLGGHSRLALPTGVGVDLFFAISGFIMVYASERLFTRPGAGGEFLLRRISRVAPLYWASTTAVLCLMLLGSRGWSGLPAFSYIAFSYLFIPDDAFGSVDGIAFPLLSLGWTLNYEMLFYVIFSSLLILPRTRAVTGVAVVMISMVLVGQYLKPASIVLSTWSQPIILEFVLGMCIGNAFLQGIRLSRKTSAILLCLAITWIAVDPFDLVALRQTPSDFRRLFGWGVPAAAVLASVILTPWAMPAGLEKPALLLGDASYSLYLTHPFALIGLEKIWPRLFGTQHFAAMVVAAITAAVILAIAVHRLVERPLDLALKNVRMRARSPRLAVET